MRRLSKSKYDDSVRTDALNLSPEDVREDLQAILDWHWSRPYPRGSMLLTQAEIDAIGAGAYRLPSRRAA